MCCLAGCPIGCPKGKPQSLFVGPPEEIHLERTGPCTFRATPPLRKPYRKPGADGAYLVMINDDAPLETPLEYDPATATFTVLDPFCSLGVTSIRIRYVPYLSTVNE
jgi:hypothetical protein